MSSGQKQQIVNTLQTGSGVVVRPTKTQEGGFLGMLLASIGVPLLLNALTGKGLEVDRHHPRRSLKKRRKTYAIDAVYATTTLHW